MKHITDFINESLDNDTIMESKVSSEKEVFGDDLDEEKMKETIDGLLDDNKDLVDDGEWGELVGMLNKSFAK